MMGVGVYKRRKKSMFNSFHEIVLLFTILIAEDIDKNWIG